MEIYRLADDTAAAAEQHCYPNGETVARGPVRCKKMEGRGSARPGRAKARPSTIGCAKGPTALQLRIARSQWATFVDVNKCEHCVYFGTTGQTGLFLASF
jgi:hypothetical protein